MIRRRDPEAGLTLIEVLVVLAIIGVMAGVTMLGLGALDRGTRAEAEARRLADRLQLAIDESMVSNAVFAMVWDEHGYRFDQWDADAEAWRESNRRLLGPRHALAGALRLASVDGAAMLPVLISSDLAPELATVIVTGRATPWSVTSNGFAVAATPMQAQND